jgi:hypothetical protein
MIKLTIDELQRVQNILTDLVCVENFELRKDYSSGLGDILTLSYDTFVGDYRAKMSIEVTSVKDW